MSAPVQWEYLHRIGLMDTHYLDEIGVYGWELVTCQFNDMGAVVAAVFKRPVTP